MSIVPQRNFLHILRDIGWTILERLQDSEHARRLRLKDMDAQQDAAEIGKQRFDIIPTRSLGSGRGGSMEHATTAKKDEEAEAGGEKSSAKGDVKIVTPPYQRNYMRDYVKMHQEQVTTAEEQAKKEAAIRQAVEKEAADKAWWDKKEADEKQDKEYRYRARELQSEISWWENQLGRGQYEDNVIESTIAALQQQLYSIPSYCR